MSDAKELLPSELFAAIDSRDKHIEALKEALRFYALGLHLDMNEESRAKWFTLVDRPDNWRQRGGTVDEELIEDGTVALTALTGQTSHPALFGRHWPPGPRREALAR